MQNTILKLVYKRDYFDISEMRLGAKQTFTITEDGIVEKEYAPGGRKARSARTVPCSRQAFVALCKQIVDCIERADRWDSYCDDTSEELTIYHCYGRVQKMDRGLGNQHTNIGDVMNSFLRRYLDCSGVE